MAIVNGTIVSRIVLIIIIISKITILPTMTWHVCESGRICQRGVYDNEIKSQYWYLLIQYSGPTRQCLVCKALASSIEFGLVLVILN